MGSSFSKKMYIYKIVIDANCINSLGRIEAMNQLEAYHDAGIIELLRTSTLHKEFSKATTQKDKAIKYQTIGASSYHQSLDDENFPEAMGGGVLGHEDHGLFKKFFPNKQTGKGHKNSIRDILHIQQAMLNHCDYFITEEKALRRGSQHVPGLIITTPEECLETLEKEYISSYETINTQELKNRLDSSGPITLGSNTCHSFKITDVKTKRLLISAVIVDGHLHIHANFFDRDGNQQLEIIPGKKPKFYSGDLSISCGGRGGIVVGERNFQHFMIGNDNQINLAARLTHTGRVIFYTANMFSDNASHFFRIEKGALTLQGVTFS